MNSIRKNIFPIIQSLLRYALFFAWIFPGFLMAQGVVDQEIVIEKDKEIKLKSVNKRFSNVPVLNIRKDSIPIFYNPQELFFPPEALLVQVNPLLDQGGENEDLEVIKNRNLYLAAGYGNFGKTYFRGIYQDRWQDKLDYGLEISHLASRNGEVLDNFSGANENRVALVGRYHLGASTLSGQVFYQRNINRYYGYDPSLLEGFDRDTLKHRYQRIGLMLSQKNTQLEQALDYQWALRVQNTSDNFEANELQLRLGGKFRYSLNDHHRILLGVESFFSQYQDSTEQNRSLFSIKPQYNYKKDRLNLAIGLNLTYTNDSLGADNQVYLYPALKASYQISSNFNVYGGLEGQIGIEDLAQHSLNNPFLEDNVVILHHNQKWEGLLGLRYNLSANLMADFSVRYADLENLSFYTNSPRDSARFRIIYDRASVKRFNVQGQLTYNLNEAYRFSLRANWYNYNLGTLEEPWHRPTLDLRLLASGQVIRNLKLKADLFVLGGLKARNFISDETVNLDTIIDLNIKADYSFLNNFSAFLSVNNIFAKSYQRFLYYPNQGLNYLIGLTYAF